MTLTKAKRNLDEWHGIFKAGSEFPFCMDIIYELS